MSNKIVCITKCEADIIKEDIKENENIFFAEIFGDKINKEEDFVKAMVETFVFPNELPEMKLGWYNDYITDLMWIKQKEIVLIIRNYELMLANDLKIKEIIMTDFKEIILPWWEELIVGHMAGGIPKKSIIYIEN